MDLWENNESTVNAENDNDDNDDDDEERQNKTRLKWQQKLDSHSMSVFIHFLLGNHYIRWDLERWWFILQMP